MAVRTFYNDGLYPDDREERYPHDQNLPPTPPLPKVPSLDEQIKAAEKSLEDAIKTYVTHRQTLQRAGFELYDHSEGYDMREDVVIRTLFNPGTNNYERYIYITPEQREGRSNPNIRLPNSPTPRNRR